MSTINLSCPFPENINPLSPNGFMFQIERLPEMKYFCQQAAIPGISLPTANMATPMVSIGFKGEQLEYDVLTVQFLIDSEMKNYRAINKWMTDNFPTDGNVDAKPSDGYLHVLGSSNQVIQTIQFANMLPISLEALTFNSTNQDVQYLVGSATFRYTYYHFV